MWIIRKKTGNGYYCGRQGGTPFFSTDPTNAIRWRKLRDALMVLRTFSDGDPTCETHRETDRPPAP